MKNFKFKIHEIVIYKFTNQRKTNKGKKLKADVFKALLILTRQFKGHIWQIFVKKIYSFHFTTKVIKQKMSADTILIKVSLVHTFPGPFDLLSYLINCGF